ncbi:MAG: hypothetical protein Q4F72_10695 [Desulfovibrionaceae bacterium]|nr:hypothetical protein [Desulfovibrionaceae bacterium]
MSERLNDIHASGDSAERRHAKEVLVMRLVFLALVAAAAVALRFL